jgi:hypothetical protein
LRWNNWSQLDQERSFLHAFFKKTFSCSLTLCFCAFNAAQVKNTEPAIAMIGAADRFARIEKPSLIDSQSARRAASLARSEIRKEVSLWEH